MNSFIAPDNTWAVWAFLLSAAAFSLWAERYRWGARLTAYILCIASGILFSNLNIVPAQAPAYDMVWGYLVSMAIPLLLFKADLKRIMRQSGPVLIAFTLGAIGTVLGTIAAYKLVPLGDEGWKLASSFCATYIGGSINYAACAKVNDLRSGDLLSAGVAADNVLTALFMLLLFAIPSFTRLVRHYPVRKGIDTGVDQGPGAVRDFWEKRPLVLSDLALSLAIATTICAVGQAAAPWVSEHTPIENPAILIISALAVALATICPGWMGKLSGGDVIGTYLMHVFFVTVGASANLATVMRVGPVLFLFAGVILVVHLVFILFTGWLFRLDIREIVIASNANVGGPPTAVALAVARRWDALIVPSILCGTLGYAIATFIGVALGNALK